MYSKLKKNNRENAIFRGIKPVYQYFSQTIVLFSKENLNKRILRYFINTGKFNQLKTTTALKIHFLDPLL